MWKLTFEIYWTAEVELMAYSPLSDYNFRKISEALQQLMMIAMQITVAYRPV